MPCLWRSSQKNLLPLLLPIPGSAEVTKNVDEKCCGKSAEFLRMNLTTCQSVTSKHHLEVAKIEESALAKVPALEHVAGAFLKLEMCCNVPICALLLRGTFSATKSGKPTVHPRFWNPISAQFVRIAQW